MCRAQVGVRTGYRAACSGYGWCAGTRERVENPRVEACALRGASERGQGDVRKLAWVRRMGVRDPVQEALPSLVVCVKADGPAMGCHTHRNERCGRWHAASKPVSLERSNSLKVRTDATKRAAKAEPRPFKRSAAPCRSSRPLEVQHRAARRRSLENVEEHAAPEQNAANRIGCGQADALQLPCSTTARAAPRVAIA